jgi:uncharacterized membrane protein (DUF4010 family)
LLADVAYRGVMLSTAAMALRNAVILGLLSTRALVGAAAPLALLLGASLALALKGRRASAEVQAPTLALESPFSLQSALKFGLIFLILQIVSTLAQDVLGEPAFYAVSVAGGLVSSASAVASAGSLAAHGTLSPAVAGTGAVLASLASAMVNLVLTARISGDRALTVRLTRALGGVMLLGVIGAAAFGVAMRTTPALAGF